MSWQLMDRVYRLRQLAGRCDSGIGLEMDEVHDLNALEAEFRSDDPRREFGRKRARLHAVIRRQQRTDRVITADIGPGGVCLADCPPVRVGDSIEVHLWTDVSELSYRFVARVRWIEQTNSGNLVGLQFAGTPIEMRHGPPSENPPADLLTQVEAYHRGNKAA